jgi:O-antigen ligase
MIASSDRGRGARFQPSLPFALLILFVGALWLGGGASRPDTFGQLTTRAVSALVLVCMALFGDLRPLRQSRIVPFFLIVSFMLVVAQLIPLPPAVWQALPGRTAFEVAAAGDAQPWRPWAIVPGAALNAAVALIVPAAAFVLLSALPPSDQARLPGVALSLIAASMLLGLLQLSGGGMDNPLINDSPGQISGSFANRNHFALFLTFGCLLAPVWAFSRRRALHWRGPIALGFIILFPLTIIASGSRVGMLLGALALAIALALTRRDIRGALRRFPRWVFPTAIAVLIVSLVGLAAMTVLAGRALSIDRVLDNEVGQDMRARALPVVWSMLREYFPAGAGFGGFDPLFRMHEPFELLKLTYFNHAHNDWLELVLDGGVVGLALLLAAVGWWLWASLRVWRAPTAECDPLARTGSAMLLLILVASAFDYPARTPMMMVMIVMAALWLERSVHPGAGSALPRSDQLL